LEVPTLKPDPEATKAVALANIMADIEAESKVSLFGDRFSES
jgi:hypothetical protein